MKRADRREWTRDLLWSQTRESRYLLLDLFPDPAAEWTLALAGRERCAPDYALVRPRYAFHAVEYVVEGAGEIVLDEMRCSIGPGSVYCYAPDTHCEMRTDPRRPLTKFFFAIAGRAARERLRAFGIIPGQAHRLAPRLEARPLAELLVAEGGHAGPQHRAVCLALLDALLLKLGAGAVPPTLERGLARGNFQRLKEQIDHLAPTAGWSLPEIARRAGMDVSSACRLFRRFQGVTISRYLLRRRMDEAAALLLGSPLLVKEVAAAVGFADPYHFTRCFRKVHGVPPSALREEGSPAGALVRSPPPTGSASAPGTRTIRRS